MSSERARARARVNLKKRRVTALARAAVDELALRTLGAEYNDRIEELKRDTNEFGVDPWGVDPDWIRSTALAAAWLHRYYFRVSSSGLENIPRGRALIISNHGGQVPFDGMMIAASMLLEGTRPRVPRILVEKWSR